MALRVHEGTLYHQDYKNEPWWPARDYDLKWEKDKPQTPWALDPSAPLLCDCGSTAWHVKSPSGEYETSIKCVVCGAESVVHQG